MVERGDLQEKKQRVRETLCYPYCDQKLNKWQVSENSFSEWKNDFIYICFNDRCAY